MVDNIFENSRLVSIYDYFDGQRNDLDHYLAIARELEAESILDIGCGTGCLATLLSMNGFDVIGLDPARASLDIARLKPCADKVKWILGTASDLPPTTVDMAVMTGNVAQVFLTDESFEKTLKSIQQALNPNGHLVFEVRDPTQQAWLDWTRKKTYQRLDVPGIGFVEGWCDVTEVSNGLVSFRWTYVFESDGKEITSDSTLRFRERSSIEALLDKAGYQVREVRDAPDRPGKEFVFIAALT